MKSVGGRHGPYETAAAASRANFRELSYIIIRKDEYIAIAVDDCRNVNARQQDASNRFADTESSISSID